MVAYSFHSYFVEPIRANSKRQTIRRARKRHARPGERLQLYTGMRSRRCELIAVRWCLSVHECRIVVDDLGICEAAVEGVPIQDLSAFAVADGFPHLAGMGDFWGLKHGQGTFDDLVLIRWRVYDADDWNQLYPVGTKVAYFEAIGGTGIVTRTRSQAWELRHGESVVLLEGGSGGKALWHVEPIP